MMDQESLRIFIEKVPDLKSPWRAFLTCTYTLTLAAICVFFFYFIDRLKWYGPILSQLVMAVIVTVIGFLHLEKAKVYRERYGPLAYQYFFYHFMIPYLVTWYACFFHPLFVSGPPVLPRWAALGLGIFFLLLFVLTSRRIEQAGFAFPTYGMDIYTIFPEQAPVVYGKIYGYIRHPLYFALLSGSIGLGLLRNNWTALVVSLLQLIPAGIIGCLEDQELLKREGEGHQDYLENTPALIPIRRMGSFLKLLFSWR